MDNYIKTFREMISLRGLTDHTIRAYTTYIKAYLDYLQNILHKNPEEVTYQELREFVIYLQKQRQLSDRTMNACISQLKFFTLYVLHQPWDSYQLPLRKFDTFLPYVPSREEVWNFISTIDNVMLKTMTALMYSAGLRIGEVCKLSYDDIKRREMRIYIAKGKNRSDRYTILSKNMLELLTVYWFSYGKPRGWLFSQTNNSLKPIDTQTISRHFKEHSTIHNFNPKLTCHSLRHGFGSHMYEDGVDLLTIKTLLGHKSFSSTAIYITLASNSIGKTTSPFDKMGGERFDKE
jgi:site-specific recombinase XerD